MACLNGTWKLVSVDNFEAYLEIIGVSSQNVPRALKLLTPENNISQEIEVNGENIRIKTNTPVASPEVKAVIDTEMETRALDGRETKAVYTIKDDQIIETISGPFDAVVVRRLDGDSMIMDMTSGEVTSTRRYEKV
ncbi:hypothetical protein SNE40_003584 [Patella caerulea]|uniref:Cytosolic fatty-acid binding proteins domain-containing protein n=1 Tax=Patella caerulea TaxID=87958 RepID=A0AAN8Q0E6_PATCE